MSGEVRDGRIAVLHASEDQGPLRMYVVNSDGSEKTQIQISPDLELWDPPTWSPGGTSLVLSTTGGLWRISRDGTGLERVTEVGLAWNPALSPDGSRLAFSREEADKGPNPMISVLEQNGSITFLGEGERPAWSPDGLSIAYIRQAASGFYGLWLMGADGANPRQLTLEVDTVDLMAPAWSPDGTSIAFTASTFEQAPDLFLTNAAGTTLRRLTDDPDFDGYPSWSPDGRRLAFVAVRDDVPGLHVLWLDGGASHRVATYSPGDIGGISWGPPASGGLVAAAIPTPPPTSTVAPATPGPTPPQDLIELAARSRIAFVGSESGGGASAYTVRPDGSNVTRLLLDAGPCCGGIAWSPDGRQMAIAVLQEAEGPLQYTIRVGADDGSSIAEVYQGAASTPSWSPDGARLVFAIYPDGIAGPVSRTAIAVFDLQTRHLQLVTDDARYNDQSPSWSPDDTLVFVRMASSSGGQDDGLWTAASDGAAARQLAELPVIPSDPVWSPDSSSIAFWSEPEFSIYSISAEGTTLSRLTTDRSDTSPTWSSDGSFIAFQSQRDRSAEIYVMRPDGSDQVRITPPDDGIDSIRPAWGRLPSE